MSKKHTSRQNPKGSPDQTASARLAPDAGSPLHLWDRVLLTLMYYRTYLTQDGLTHLFGITQGSISTNIGKMSPVIRDILPLPQKLYKQPARPPPSRI